ncbi:MAG: alpha/beta fold hydrolase [Beijerinckiaceae bacterium]|nr:alpha/beta fold hydrolase [Beijerinckiaceae bacterium]
MRTLILAAMLLHGASAAKADPVSFKAADGVKVFADFQAAGASSKGLVVLFHQASSSRHEYDSIAPKLRQLGFDTLAVDQRSGGSLFGPNETAAGARGGADFLSAYKDMEAALTWAEMRAGNRPVVIWGSSYSASLVFVLAAQHPQSVKAVLAFSPGEYFGARSFVRDAAAKVKAPVFVSSDSGGEAEEARVILAAVPGQAKTQYVPKSGSHGSSSLIESRNPRGAAENWRAVDTFLAALK